MNLLSILKSFVNGKCDIAVLSPFNCIYTNLAIESYLINELTRMQQKGKHEYQLGNAAVLNNKLIFAYINTPSIVMGRNQNLFIEANLKHIKKYIIQQTDKHFESYLNELLDNKHIRIARRISGGGTVIHDRGNLNVCILTSSKEYNPSKNIDILGQFIYHLSNNKLTSYSAFADAYLKFSSKHDLCVNSQLTTQCNVNSTMPKYFKITGSAMKYSSVISLHHYTVLVNSDISKFPNLIFGSDKKVLFKEPIVSNSGQPRIKEYVGACNVNGFDSIKAIGVASIPNTVTTLSNLKLVPSAPCEGTCENKITTDITEQYLAFLVKETKGCVIKPDNSEIINSTEWRSILTLIDNYSSPEYILTSPPYSMYKTVHLCYMEHTKTVYLIVEIKLSINKNKLSKVDVNIKHGDTAVTEAPHIKLIG